MSVVLFRVDERLIHGQVVVGWGRRLRVRRIVVVDDRLAAAAQEQEIYRTGVPEGIGTSFWSEDVAVERIAEVTEGDETALVLTESLVSMGRLVDAGVPVEEVNVGGIHAGPGREKILPYVHLSPSEVEIVRALEAAEVRVVALDVPGGEPVRLVDRIR